MKTSLLFFLLIIGIQLNAQFNFNFDINNNGQRVCLVSATANENPTSITINLLDNYLDSQFNYTIKRRPINGLNSDWTTVATNVTALNWTDTNVAVGDAFEYQVRRLRQTFDAIGYVTACVRHDQTNYKGQMILLIDNSFQNSLANEISQLKQDLTFDGWFVNELFVPRATTWETEPAILSIKQSITNIYNNAPANDKPKHLFLLGHIPIVRSGLGEPAPDEHDENKGARGADCFYADIDGVFTDTQTYNVAGIDSKAINLPNDSKFDQDYIPSQLEMAFGRVDFADLNDAINSEENLLRNYLNRLHNYRIVANGFDMGNKTAFNFGYDNSNDGSYRSLIPISGANNVDSYSGTTSFNDWVLQNGPYQIFMQNIQVPDINLWENVGMKATIFSSDQSYWGFWDDPFTTTEYGKIRSLLSKNTKCLGLIYTTTGINIFHQPGMGETMGWSCKRIMDHNQINNLYEKPSQQYDTPDFWGRTHFQYHGDPTLRLNQVKPPTNVLQNGVDITWTASADDNIIGYHVYRSYSPFGRYERITANPITNVTFTDTEITAVVRYFIIKAIKLETTGSGNYLNPSIGVAPNQNLKNTDFEAIDFEIYPNPADDFIVISSSKKINQYEIIDLLGKKVLKSNFKTEKIDVSGLQSGVYILKVEDGSKSEIHKFIKN